MKLENRFTVPVPRDEAWKVLLDVERIAPCMPGAKLLSRDGDSFTGQVKVKLGPINLTYGGKAQFVELDEAGGIAVIDASGKETRGTGTAKATITCRLIDQGASTDIEVDTDLAITGKPAQFGRGVLADVSAKLVDQFAACLSEEIQEGTPSGGPGETDPATGLTVAARPRRCPPPPAPPATTGVDIATEVAASSRRAAPLRPRRRQPRLPRPPPRPLRRGAPQAASAGRGDRPARHRRARRCSSASPRSPPASCCWSSWSAASCADARPGARLLGATSYAAGGAAAGGRAAVPGRSSARSDVVRAAGAAAGGQAGMPGRLSARGDVSGLRVPLRADKPRSLARLSARATRTGLRAALLPPQAARRRRTTSAVLSKASSGRASSANQPASSASSAAASTPPVTRGREGEEERRAPAARVDVDDVAAAHGQPGLLRDLAGGGVARVLVGVDVARRQRPEPLARRDAAAHEQQPARVVAHHRADPHLGVEVVPAAAAACTGARAEDRRAGRSARRRPGRSGRPRGAAPRHRRARYGGAPVAEGPRPRCCWMGTCA